MTVYTNELRRLAQKATPGPWKMLPVGDGRQKFAVADSEFLSILTVTDEGGGTFGTVYDDDDARFIAAANPAAISELLDSLEAAEKERDWHAERCEDAMNECEALRAKITEMERQEIGFRERCTPSSPTGYSNRFPLYALPGAKGEEK